MKKIRFALVALALAAAFHFIPYFDPSEAWLVRGFGTVGFGIRNATLYVVRSFERIWAAGRIEKENFELKERIRSLDEKLASASALIAENDSLNGLLRFSSRTDLELVPALVIGADPDTTARSLIIDRGSERGILRGDAVIAGDGTLVGKIERSTAGRSTVLLPTDPRSSLAVMVSDHPESNGVAQGEKGLVVAMTLIPQHAPIKEGDTIVTTGREKGIPRGLVLGMVESVNSVASDPFMSATVVPELDPIDLIKVAVVRQR